MVIETFNISFESTQNKQQYGTIITCAVVRGKRREKSSGDFKSVLLFLEVLTYSLPFRAVMPESRGKVIVLSGGMYVSDQNTCETLLGPLVLPQKTTWPILMEVISPSRSIWLCL